MATNYRKWFGTLTQDNAEEICQALRQLLKNSRYVVVITSESEPLLPAISTNIKLVKAVVYHFKDHVELTISDSRGQMTWRSNAKFDEPGNRYLNPYLSFDNDEVRIWNKSEHGTLTSWTLVKQ